MNGEFEIKIFNENLEKDLLSNKLLLNEYYKCKIKSENNEVYLRA